MFKFGENNLVTGYIKELLHNFPLPTCEIIKEGKTPLYPNTIYIKDGDIILTNSDITPETMSLGNNYKYKDSYTFGKDLLNLSKKLKLNSLLYDSYTHEYLGDFLRFFRDITGIDLMILYNCFSSRLVTNLKYHNFDTSDSRYKIYMVPVKFNKKYLIGVDSSMRVELACGFYKDTQITNIDENGVIYSSTYKNFGSMSFTNPKQYEVKIDGGVSQLFKDYESCLKLYIKLPLDNNSSISIVETDEDIDYFTQSTDGNIADIVIPKENDLVNYPTKLSLFKLNDGNFYPFADRLIEFLFGNVITPIEQIGENIENVQIQLSSLEQLKINGHRLGIIKDFGVWDNDIRELCYKIALYRSENNSPFIKNVYDVTGYVDKDMEKLITVVSESEVI